MSLLVACMFDVKMKKPSITQDHHCPGIVQHIGVINTVSSQKFSGVMLSHAVSIVTH